MRSLSIIWTFLAGALAALAFVALRHAGAPAPDVDGERSLVIWPAETRLPHAARDDARNDAHAVLPEAGPAATPGTRDAAPAAAGHGAAEHTVADAVGAELRAMSEGYRNRILLRAIRERGHYCDGIVDTQLGQTDVVVWRIACRAGRAYLVSIDSVGELAIDALYYGDPSPVGVPLQRGPGPEQRSVPTPDTQ